MRIRLVVGIFASVLIILGFVFFRIFSISTKSVVLYPLTFFNDFISVSSGEGVLGAMINSVIDPLFFVVPLIPITLAFCVLIFYGLHYGEDKRFCMIVCLIPSALGAVIAGLSITSLLFVLAMVACGFIVSPLAIMYLRELKKWKRYRIGSRTVSKCFLLINLFLFFAVFVDVFIGLDDYNAVYRQETEDFVLGLLPGIGDEGMPKIEDMELMPQEQISQEYSNLTESQRDEVKQKVSEMFQSGNISSLIDISLFFTPLMVFAILETLRLLVIAPIAGLATGLMFRKMEN